MEKISELPKAEVLDSDNCLIAFHNNYPIKKLAVESIYEYIKGKALSDGEVVAELAHIEENIIIIKSKSNVLTIG